LMLIELVFLGLLETYYEIKRHYPKKKFTTETSFPMRFTIKAYVSILLKYLPLSIVLLLLELLLKIKI